MSAASSSSPAPLSPLNGSDNDSDNGEDESNRCVRRRVLCPPPSFNDARGSTRPFYLFPLFLLINIATMTDRTIIAGASQEFSAFVSGAHDSPRWVKENPDAGIGILQSAFIFGYSIAILLSGHFVHTMRWKPLVLGGLCVWWLGVLGSGNARRYDSFYVLLFSRMATGCSEAAFQLVAPPLIQDRGGDRAGLWLSIYLTGLPVGLALGFICGSRVATSWGWDWAYYIMCVASVPLLVMMMFVKDETNGGILSGAGGYVDSDTDDGDSGALGEDRDLAAHQPLLTDTDGDDNRTHQKSEGEGDSTQRKFTLLSEAKACLSSPTLVALSLGWAAIIGSLSSLATFGGAFVLALQLYDDERDAAYWFGIAAALAGIIGTPLGGKLADKVLERYNARDGDAGEGVDDSLRYPIIASMTSRINALVALSLIFAFPTLAMHDAAPFLAFLFVGWTLLFMTQTAINLVAMLSVDRAHRPNAVAFLTLTSHIAGDVPLPIVLGLLKDKWAPACMVDASGDFVDREQCAEQETGVRRSLAVAYVWLLWSLLFFEATRRFARREIGKSRRGEVNNLLQQEANGTGEDSTFQHYHTRFQPPGMNESAGDDESSPLNGREAMQE